MSGMSSTPTPNSSEPSTPVSTTWPAVRIDEEVAEPHVEDDLRGDPGVGAAEEDGERPLAARRARAGGRRPGWGAEWFPLTNRALPAASSAHASAGVDARRTVTSAAVALGRAHSPGLVLMLMASGLRVSAKKSLPLSSTTMNAGKSSTSIFQTASMPSSGYSSTSTCLMQSWASRAAGPPIEPR